MKKNRIISLILALSLIFGVFSVLPVSAEENDSTAVEILAQNVAYAEKVQIVYAVDVALEDASSVTVEYYIDGAPEITYKASLLDTSKSDYIYKDEDGVDHPTFATFGFHATDFTDVVYVTAYIGDEAPENAVYKKYSVAEYFYARLYKYDFINKEIDDTDETTIANTKPDCDRKNLYLSMLNYGKYAQEVLVNNKGGSETLITDYCYLWTTEDNITVNGAKSAFVAPGEEVKFAGADSYTATTVDGKSTEVTAPYIAEAGVVAKVTAKSATDTYTVMDYENGASNDYVKTYDADDNLITESYVQGSSLSMGLNVEGENHFMQVRNPANSGKTGRTEIYLSNKVQEGSCYTFGAKIQVVGGTAGYNIAQLKFVNTNGGEALNLFLGYATVDGKTGVAIATTGDNSSVTKGTKLFDAGDKTIATGTWFDLRIEFYFGGVGTENAKNTYLKIYVDDTLVYDGQANWAMGAGISYAQIDHISAGKTHNTCYDDIYFTQTDKAYVSDSEE